MINKHTYKCNEIENLAEKIGHVIRESAAQLFDVANHRGHYASDGIVMKETDRLLHDFAVNAVPEIRDGGKSHILNQRAAKIFRKRLEQKDKKQSERKNRPDVMYPGRNQIVHVHDVVCSGNLKEDQFLNARTAG